MSTQLLRSVLPSWSFFSDTGLNPKLYVYEGSDRTQLIEKKSHDSPSTRKFWHLFLNPQNNLKIRQNAILFHLIIESQQLSPQQLLESSTFLSVKFLVNNLCEQKFFQFRLYNQIHDEPPQLAIESSIYLKEFNE